MKKILALVMTSVIAVMTLASCGGKYSEGGKFKKGEVADGTYVNETVGIAIKLPENMEVQKTEGLPPVENVTYDLHATDENGNSVTVISTKHEKKVNITKVASDSLKEIKEYYEDGEYVVDDAKEFDCNIGGNTYRAYTIDYTVNEEKYEQYAIFVECRGSVVTIAYTGRDGETEKFIKENFIKA